MVRYNKFEICAENAFTNLLENELFVDVTLVSEEGRAVKAHKVVIAACSDLFKDILESVDSGSPLIYLHGIQHQELRYVLDFMYKGKAEVPEGNLPEFMKVAQELKLKGLILSESECNAAIELDKEAINEEIQSPCEQLDISNEEEKLEEGSGVEVNATDSKESEGNDDEIYMDMKRCNYSLNIDEKLETKISKRKREIKIARYQNSLKDFEVYKKNFNKKQKQMDETGTEVAVCESVCCDQYECNLCAFSTKFEEIFERHQLRHQLTDLQNSGFNISKENFTLPF